MHDGEGACEVVVEVVAEGALDGKGEGLGRDGPEVEDAEPEGECEDCANGNDRLEVAFAQEGDKFVSGDEGDKRWAFSRGHHGARPVLSVSAWAEDEVGCGFIPEGCGDGEVFLVLARLCCPFDVHADDVEVFEVTGTGSGGGGALEAEATAEALAVCFPPSLEDVDDVGDGPAVDGLCRREEVVEELGDLVGVQGGCEGVPEEKVDLVEAVGAVWDVEDGVDGGRCATRHGDI
jgi:hypothetical protein